MGLVVHPDVVSIGVDLRTPDELRAALVASVAALRWQAQQQFTLHVASDSALAAGDGYVMPNNTDAKTNVIGALQDMQGQDASTTRRWKFADDKHPTIWLDLTADALSELGRAMAVAQQAAFDREESLTKEIQDAGDPNTVDLMTGWPD